MASHFLFMIYRIGRGRLAKKLHVMLNLTKCKAIVGALFLTIGSVSAQDIIVLNNNTADEIQAKVIEVSDSEVKYKKWAYQDGPTFTITTAKIFVIKDSYSDAETVFFDPCDFWIFDIMCLPCICFQDSVLAHYTMVVPEMQLFSPKKHRKEEKNL